MGLQGTEIGELSGASVLIIDQTCDNDQLLVSLCRNDKEWLSPVGWKDSQKITLLDCRSIGGQTEIDIPTEFAKHLKIGDKLVLTCSELDLTQTLTWQHSNVAARVEEETSTPEKAAGGLLSRFKPKKSDDAIDLKTEAERRADDADRAAENYRAKMEAATAAKEEAHRRALEAAREAEAALKMEGERIAEMERAAKALEDAERLKQDEHRRVEDERRAEEARLAEEARRIEMARKREIAAKVEAERKAALERFTGALDVTQNEEVQLKDQLALLKKDAAELSEQKSAKQASLEKTQETLQKVESKVETQRGSFEKISSKLDDVTSELSNIQIETDSLMSEREMLISQLSVLEADYQAAQKEAELAMARAEEQRKMLDARRQEDTEIAAKLTAASAKLDDKSKIVADTAEKTQKLLAKYEAAEVELIDVTQNFEAMRDDELSLSEADQSLRHKIEATQQAIEDTQAREAAHRKAIAHLEAGGDPSQVSDVSTEQRFFERADSFEAMDDAEENTSLMTRVRSTFSRNKDAEISIEVDDVSLTTEAADPIADDVSLNTADIELPSKAGKSFLKRPGTSLLAIGVILGGMAIVGGGYALNQSGKTNKISVKAAQPAPTKVASLIKTAEAPKPVAAIELAPAPVVAEPLVKTPIAADPVQMTAEKTVEVSSAAFELPNMMPEVLPAKAKLDIAVDKVMIKKPAVNKAAAKPAAAPANRNYPEVTTSVQESLTALGYYTGPINGYQNRATRKAIREYKAAYSLPAGDMITGSLLSSLKRAGLDAAKAEKEAAAQLEAQPQTDLPDQSFTVSSPAVEAPVKFADAAPVVEFYDSAPTVDFQPSATDTLSAAETITYDSSPYVPVETPAVQSYEPVVTQEATAPVIATPAPVPAVQDVIVEAKRTKAAGAKYPSRALRGSYFVDASIVVEYDVDAAGKVINPRIKSSEGIKKYTASFEKEAINAAKKQRFEPKTINGTPVISENDAIRIVFRAE